LKILAVEPPAHSEPQPATREPLWSDERLVRECREGSQAAWSALIEKYKNLIFSIPIKCGLSREDAADVFQAVCVDALLGLHRLREPKALPKWLMQVSFHQCLRWKQARLPSVGGNVEVQEEPEANGAEIPEELLYQVEREQCLRESIAALNARCNRMVGMLFFEHPPRPYHEVAKELKLATGSIGFIRGRCLQKLRQLLEAKGFK